jgi:hypothetical protein
MPAPGLGLLLLLPLIAWRLYARFRRLVGRQRATRVRPWITLTVFPLLIALITYLVRFGPPLGWLAAGLFAGALLGVYGLRKTRFEPTAAGLFYTPNAHLGIALSLLFAGRIVYRMAELYLSGGAAFVDRSFVGSALTLVIFGLLAGYYIAYAVGLVRWRRAVLRLR